MIGEFFSRTGVQNLYHWNSDTTTDSSGNSRNLTQTGTVANQMEKFGKGVSADWKLANRLTGVSFNPGTGTLSLAIWFKKNGAPLNDYTPTIMAIGTTSARAWIGVDKTTGYAHFGSYDGANTNVATTKNICDNVWHFIIGVRSGTNHYLYVDGVQVGYISGTARNINATTLNFGQHQDGVDFDVIGQAELDEAMISNVALSASEIRKWYAWARGRYI